MFSEIAMVARKEFEKMYDSKCDIYKNKEITKANMSIGYEEVKVYENEPCRVSSSSKTPSSPTDNMSNISMNIKLFISPNIKVMPGSRIVVTSKKEQLAFKSSGIPAVYDTHQEIVLESFEEYA